MRDLSGTGQVYCFTLSQLLKSNANRITLLLMVLLAAVSMPLTALMRGESPEVSDTSSLTAVRLENRTALDLDFSGDSYWADTVFSAGAEDPDAVVTVSGDVTGYQVAVSGADDVDQSELRLLADAVQTAIRDACVRAAGLTAQQLAQLEGSPLPEENFDGSPLLGPVWVFHSGYDGVPDECVLCDPGRGGGKGLQAGGAAAGQRKAHGPAGRKDSGGDGVHLRLAAGYAGRLRGVLRPDGCADGLRCPGTGSCPVCWRRCPRRCRMSGTW